MAKSRPRWPSNQIGARPLTPDELVTTLNHDHRHRRSRSKRSHRQRWPAAVALLRRHEAFQGDHDRACLLDGAQDLADSEATAAQSIERRADAACDDRTADFGPR